MPSLAQRLFSEWLGTGFLLAAVVGSGIMAAKLAGGNGAVALLCNTLATGAILIVLISVFGPLSGAHFNPAVSVAFALRGALSWPEAALYIGAQLVGGIVGVWAAHLMFELPLWQFSMTSRTGTGQWLAEAVATFGLVSTICGCVARAPSAVPFAVGLYITSAYWFTASNHSPIRRSPLRAPCPTRLPGLRPLVCWRSSSRNWSGCSRRWLSRYGCGPKRPRPDLLAVKMAAIGAE